MWVSNVFWYEGIDKVSYSGLKTAIAELVQENTHLHTHLERGRREQQELVDKMLVDMTTPTNSLTIFD